MLALSANIIKKTLEFDKDKCSGDPHYMEIVPAQNRSLFSSERPTSVFNTKWLQLARWKAMMNEVYFDTLTQNIHSSFEDTQIKFTGR